MKMKRLAVLLLLQGAVALPASAALITTSFEPSAAAVTVGSRFTVDLLATVDVTTPVLAWGLDLGFDDSNIRLTGAPEIGPSWTAVPTGDGDGLAGVAFPFGVTGVDVLLARLTFEAITPFTDTIISVGITASDLLEGFFVRGSPGRFTDVDISSTALITVNPRPVPEPDTLWLFAAAMLLCAARLRGQANSS